MYRREATLYRFLRYVDGVFKYAPPIALSDSTFNLGSSTQCFTRTSADGDRRRPDQRHRALICGLLSRSGRLTSKLISTTTLDRVSARLCFEFIHLTPTQRLPLRHCTHNPKFRATALSTHIGSPLLLRLLTVSISRTTLVGNERRALHFPYLPAEASNAAPGLTLLYPRSMCGAIVPGGTSSQGH